MASVTYSYAEKDGHFMLHDADGKEIKVEAGKNFSTSDPGIQAALDAEPSVKRVERKKEE